MPGWFLGTEGGWPGLPAPALGGRPVARLDVPVVAHLGHQPVAVEAGEAAPGEGGRRAVLVAEPGPVLHAGPVALHHRGAETHLLDRLLLGERPGDVLADALPAAVGRPERGRA